MELKCEESGEQGGGRECVCQRESEYACVLISRILL